MISLRAVSKTYADGFFAVERLDLDIQSGELCMLVGPSGCGKTTTLKMINRLVEPSSGKIFIDGDNILDIDPVQLRRRIGYVMQHGGLFPHLRVAENVGVVPRLLGWSKTRIRDRVGELLELVGLEPSRYERRYPHELSGGERQRVGVARALGGDPPVLLMDEPFGAVDPITRKRLQTEFRELQALLNKTVIFVTHDIDEAITLGTTIAVLRKGGNLEQLGTPQEVIGHPATPFVADFVGSDGNLERLGISRIELQDLTRVPIIAETTPLREAEEVMLDARTRMAVTLDGSNRPARWLALNASFNHRPVDTGPETVAGRLRPIEATALLGASFKEALSTMLSHDGGFVAVLNDDRYVGILTLEDLFTAMRRVSDIAPSTPGGERASKS